MERCEVRPGHDAVRCRIVLVLTAVDMGGTGSGGGVPLRSKTRSLRVGSDSGLEGLEGN